MINEVFAVLAAWRLTEIITADVIFEPIRKYIPKLSACPRCASVWAGLAAVLAYKYFPWFNWPFALSWLYIERGVVSQLINQKFQNQASYLQLAMKQATVPSATETK